MNTKSSVTQAVVLITAIFNITGNNDKTKCELFKCNKIHRTDFSVSESTAIFYSMFSKNETFQYVLRLDQNQRTNCQLYTKVISFKKWGTIYIHTFGSVLPEKLSLVEQTGTILCAKIGRAAEECSARNLVSGIF